MTSKANEKIVPSPLATGQSGGFFEQQVGATWLSLLLVRAIPPLLLDSQIVRVAFQTRHLGWQTDDILVCAETGERKSRKLACQVKRTFTVSSSDEECRKLFRGFWADFTSPNFDRMADRLCFITLQGTKNLLVHLAGLFECAAIARTLEDFKHRLSTQGLLHAQAKKYAEEIRKGLEEDQIVVADGEFWQFLRSLAVLSFDLNTRTSQTEAWVKSLLAYVADGADKTGAAKSTWDALLNLVSNAMPAAQEFVRDNLPESVRVLHAPISNVDHGSFLALGDHSVTILRGIRGAINGSLILDRNAVVANTLESLLENRIIVLSGPAGVGKSAIAKTLLEKLSGQYFTFSFRAEEFAKPHLDETLHSFGLGMSGERLSALLAGHGQKILLIESVERLLEATVRDSFSDLLRLIEKDDSWKVIITCRAYSVDLIVASFLRQMELPFAIINVPLLSDEELLEVQKSIPKLVRPLADKKLRRILSNPYVLDKAARMPWSDQEHLPENEREFRRRFWKDIVRQEDKTEEGLPLRRETALGEVALRRAKTLSLYTNCDDLDQKALRRLHQDDLVAFSEASETMVAPAHDVLEDWALLNWIELRYTQHEGDARKLAEDIGAFPALRRSYRIWLSERSNLDPDATDIYVHAVISDDTLSAHFRDDTIVSILKTDAGGNFLTRNHDALLSNGAVQLKRVVHLLRVACKSLPDWLATVGYLQSSIMVPTGSAWPNALALVYKAIADFLPKDIELTVGLLEDWSNLVGVENLRPQGYQDAAKIAFRLLEVLGGYQQRKTRERVFSILSKNPCGERDAFVDLMAFGDHRDRKAEEFADFLLEGMQAIYVAREFPDELVELAKRRLCLDETEESESFSRSSRLDVDEFFGMESHREFYPPSALRGPFLPLLRQHFKKGVECVLEFVNHAGERYANPLTHDRLEPPWEVEIKLSDGSICKQWHNPRLWQLYRGTSVGPYVLMCALMSLENVLLKMADVDAKHLDSWLLYIIGKSNNSSLSAVAASVVVAHPSKCKETAKVLLSCRDFIEIDQNMAAIGEGISHLQGVFPNLSVESEIYESERKMADALPHRRKHLVMTALELQTNNNRKEIQDIIDHHLKALPDKSKQDDSDKLWRLTLHKMDLRKYSLKDVTRKEYEQAQGKFDNREGDLGENGGIIFEPQAPEDDIAAVIEGKRPELEANQRLIGLLNWSWSRFKNDGKADATLWREYLARAMETPSAASGQGLSWEGAPAIVSAVCARDHWDVMSTLQKQWCLNAIDKAIEHDRETADYHSQVSRNPMSADRPCALLVSSIIAQESDKELRRQAVSILFDALFHACEEVTNYAAAGIGQFLWATNSEIALLSIQALTARAVELDRQYASERNKNYDERTDMYVLEIQVNSEIRERLRKGFSFEEFDIFNLNFDLSYAKDSLKQLLHIVGSSTTHEITKRFFETIVKQICAWWLNEDRDNRIPHALVGACQEKLTQFTLALPPKEAVQLCQPIFKLIDSKPKEVAELVRVLVSSVDQTHLGKETFWALWDEFASGIKKAAWLPRLDSEYSSCDEIVRAIFLGLSWKRGVRHWETHIGYEDRVVSLFEALPASATVLNQMAVYLYYIGDMTLPNAFVPLSAKIKKAPATLSDHITIFYLEQVLQRHVYGAPQSLKSNPALREAVISILDELVEKGSSAAFKMRDDFVTPMKL